MTACRECGRLLDDDEFYSCNKSVCKSCVRERVRMRRAERLDEAREYDLRRADLPHRVAARAEYASTDAGRAAQRRAKDRYADRNPEKRAAHNMLNNAVRDGRVIKGPCEECGSTDGVHGHHDDYAKPLEVRWLCPKHHAELHKEARRVA